MSFIGKSDGGAAGWTSNYPREQFNDDRGENYNAGSDGRLSSSGKGSDPFATPHRTAAFQASLHAAMHANPTGRTNEEAHQSEHNDDARLLATAESCYGIFFPPPTDSVTQTPSTLSPDIEATVAKVMAHIEWSIRADIAPRFDQPLNIHIDFAAAAIAGVSGLTLTVTPTSIDVILERSGGDLSPALAQAADALAKRLMSRFSKQTVRIFDTLPASTAQNAREFPLPHSTGFPQERDG